MILQWGLMKFQAKISLVPRAFYTPTPNLILEMLPKCIFNDKYCISYHGIP
jgi:hypothetical protein